jgi:spermidine/putrescine transport system permease protein
MINFEAVHGRERFVRKRDLGPFALSAGPGTIWLGVFFFLPLLGILAMSFARQGTYGEVEWQFTLENFKRFLGFGAFGFDPLYPTILFRSLVMAVATTMLCIIAALPLTFFIARLRAPWKSVALILVVLPFGPTC